ncbi:MAG: hypothetical protein II841_04920 [Bacteroidales bacterium]|nr:hypothetical protein [Bacteroidales bacterium]
MAEIVIPKVRKGSDITLRAKLTDNGVGVDWSGLENVVAMLYSDEQRVIAGPCSVSIDPDDNLYLVCEFGANQPQYDGLNSLVVRCEYNGRKKTYDRKALEIVGRTEELEGEAIVLDDPVLDVELSVQEVSTSLLDNAIAAAFDAAALATEAAGRNPYIGANGNWFVWSVESEAFVDSGVAAQGPVGPAGRDGVDGQDGQDGMDGGILYPTFSVDAAMHLQMDTHEDTGADRFDLTEAGHLTVEI